MRTAQDLIEEMRNAARDPLHELHNTLPSELAGRLTPGKAKDWPTHAKYIARALEVSSLGELNLNRLGHEYIGEIDRYLQHAGRGEDVRRNTKNTFKLMRAVAIAKGLIPPDPIKYEIPKRHQLYKNTNGIRTVIRPPLRKVYERYGLRYEHFNPDLKREVDDLKHFYTARIVRGRKRKAIDDSTWGARLDRLERFYGAQSQMGRPHEEAKLRDFVALDRLEEYVDYFLEAHEEPTQTLKDFLNWALNVAKNYYKDRALADEISSLLNQLRYVRVKNIEDLLLKVTADDLYELEGKLFQHAFAYDRQFYKRKSCKALKYPQAQVAWHYSRAIAIHLANRCWFRKSNLFGIVWGRHLYFYEGKLFFKFSADEMKSKEPHMGQVVDLWRGQAGYNQLIQLLERYLEVRHHLVEKFKHNHPDKPDPAELILNSDGKPYASNGAWMMFSSVSRMYLGAEKEIFPHAPRHIVPTYLMLEYDYAILGSIQALLDHKSIQTTERHYLRMKRLMNGHAAQRVIDERAARERQARSIEKMERMLLEMRSQLLNQSP